MSSFDQKSVIEARECADSQEHCETLRFWYFALSGSRTTVRNEDIAKFDRIRANATVPCAGSFIKEALHDRRFCHNQIGCLLNDR